LPVQGLHTPFMHTDRTRCNALEKPVGCERVLLAEGNSIALGLLSLAAFGPLTGTFTPPGVSALQATVIVGDRCGVSYVCAVECLAPCPDPPAGLGAGCPHDPVQFVSATGGAGRHRSRWPLAPRPPAGRCGGRQHAVRDDRRHPGFSAHGQDRKSTRLNSSHVKISYAVFC